MISFLLILGVLPGAVAYLLYPRLTTRRVAWLVAFGGAAIMAGFLAATVQFWWLPEGQSEASLASTLIVSLLLGALAGLMLIGAFVGVFGGQDRVTPRPLNRIIATAVTAMASMLICPVLIDIQNGLG